MQAEIKSAHQSPPLPFGKRGRIEAMGSEHAGVKVANPYLTLFLEKGEVTTSRNASKQLLEPAH
jgi:hypothetical protein